MVSGLRGQNYEERLRELDMDSLEVGRERLDLTQVFKIMHGIDKVEARRMFKQVEQRGNVQTRGTADALNLERSRCRLDVRLNSFCVRVTDSWNGLSHETKRLATVKGFKNALKSLSQE